MDSSRTAVSAKRNRIAYPFRFESPISGQFVRSLSLCVMVWVAWNPLLLTKILGLAGKMPPSLAAWSPALLFAVVGVYFLWRAE